MTKLPSHTFMIISLIVALSGCGQTGPLVLPQPQSPEPAAEQPQPAATNNEQ